MFLLPHKLIQVPSVHSKPRYYLISCGGLFYFDLCKLGGAVCGILHLKESDIFLHVYVVYGTYGGVSTTKIHPCDHCFANIN